MFCHALNARSAEKLQYVNVLYVENNLAADNLWEGRKAETSMSL